MRKYLEYAPHNFIRQDLMPGELGNCTEMWTLPLHVPALQITQNIHEGLLALHKAIYLEPRAGLAATRSAMKSLGCWVDSGRLSKSATHRLFLSVTNVFVLGAEEDPFLATLADKEADLKLPPLAVRCSCTKFQAKPACVHEHLVRYLKGDSRFDLDALRDYTTKLGPMREPVLPLAGSRSHAKEPSISAWKTMAEISKNASEDWAKKKAKASMLDVAVEELLDSPKRRRATENAFQDEDPQAKRSKLLSRIRDDLNDPSFASSFQGLSSVLQHKVSVQEALSLRSHVQESGDVFACEDAVAEIG